MSVLHYLIAFAIALGLLIFFHELGHYLVARWCGVKVLRFSIGFGKPLLVWKVGVDQVEWVLSPIPLGGYVKMLDEREAPVAESEQNRAFNRQTVWRRFAIVSAGPLANLLLAAVVFWVLALVGTQEIQPKIVTTNNAQSLAAQAGMRDGDTVLAVDGTPVQSWTELRRMLLDAVLDQCEVLLDIHTEGGARTTARLDFSQIKADQDFLTLAGLQPWPAIRPIVGEVMPDSPAAQAGIRSGDEFLSLAGQTVKSWPEVTEIIYPRAGMLTDVLMMRDGQKIALSLTPAEVDDEQRPGKRIGRSGIRIDPSAITQAQAQRAEITLLVRYGLWGGLMQGISQTWESSVIMLKTIWLMLKGDISWKNLSGPITIADYAGKTAKLGPSYYLGFIAFISISIGILNLLPIPVLDGGHLLYYTIEIIRGRPVSERFMEIGQQIGLAALFMLMAFALYNDFDRLFSG